jgi:O-antigen/teichoic acid export membrane protein
MPLADTLTTRTARAAQWRLFGTGVGAVLQFFVGVLLARFLTPEDFGVATLAYVVLGLAQPLGDLGLSNAVVQRPNLTDRHIRTAYTAATVWGVVIAAAMMAAAPLGAELTRTPEVSLVIRVLSIGFAFRGTAVVAEALLRRRLDFRRQVLIEVFSYVFGYGGVAVALALYGQGLWSLVWGGLAQTLIASIAQLTMVRHPSRPLLGGRELRELLRFGFGSAASSCVNYVALNGDYFIVGRTMGAPSLGLYSRAYGLMNLAHAYGSKVVSSVMFPAITHVQGDSARVRSGFLMVTRLTAMIAAPAMATMAIVAPYFVPALYGPHWTGAVVPLQILSIAGYFRALYHLGGVLAQGVGLVYGELWRQVTYATAIVGGAVVGSWFGLPGVAVGVSAAILYMFIVTGHLALNATDTSWRQYLGVQQDALLTAAVTSGVALSVRRLLEVNHASSSSITLAILSSAAIPWSVGVLWTLGSPDLDALRASLPQWCDRLVVTLRPRHSGSRAIAENE